MFISGLILFYSFQFFGNKAVIFLSYLILAGFFYLATRNFLKALTYVLILAFFSEIGIGASLFRMEPIAVNPDAGWFISPLTLLILLITPLTVIYQKRYSRINATDLLVLIFLLWNAFIIFLFPFAENVLYGIIALSEVSLAYYLLRTNLSVSDKRNTILLLISVFLFQAFLGIFQFLLGRNIGTQIEVANLLYPYGLTAVEDENLFRVTGIYGHANLLAITAVTLLPFTILLRKWAFILTNLAVLIIILTFSRTAWFVSLIFILIIFFMLFKNREYGRQILQKTIMGIILLIFLLSPLILFRIRSLGEAFEIRGSWDSRVKIFRESINLLVQFPLTGIGQNRFQQLGSEQNLTGIFKIAALSPSTKIHNLFLEIATETGLTGGLLFVIFIGNIIYISLKKAGKDIFNIDFHNVLLLSIFGLILMSMVHPVFHTSIFRIYFLFAALIFI